ncbi:hypothetical protein FOMPIDRAFT_1050734 [Fomitopsis schrenkii]|uniref:Uncharacterized protein n=1 Tax=Fomitopsis schrenkii TaxID=2126942 RepID=S8FLR7_FOMSC|nr:hypothetical protein FOMPIDRAFT_1050734 [Fomitopsis schrenkii]
MSGNIAPSRESSLTHLDRQDSSSMTWVSGPEGQTKIGCQVDSLPIETLREIIHLALSATSRDGETCPWTTQVMAVCRYWRSVVTNNPFFWTGIDLSRTSEFIVLCLQRSANAPHINLFFGPPGWRSQPEVQLSESALASIISPHYSRIVRVRLHLQDHIAACRALPLLKARLPRLSSMFLQYNPSIKANPEMLALHLNPHHLPSLRSISLSNMTVDWTGVPISQLTSLELNCVDLQRADDPLAELLDLLEAAASLQSFSYSCQEGALSEVDTASEDGALGEDDSDTADRLVSLPHIQRFSLTGMSVDIPRVLTHIKIPSDAQLLLDVPGVCDEYMDEGCSKLPPLLCGILPPRSPNLPCLGDARHLMVWVRYDIYVIADTRDTPLWQVRPWRRNPEYKWSWPPSIIHGGMVPTAVTPEPAFCITHADGLDDLTLDPLLEELCVTFPPTVETLVVRGVVGRSFLVDTECWASTLRAFPGLQELDIVAEDCNVAPFPDALWEWTDPPCLHLRTLFLRFDLHCATGEKTLSDLCSALQHRADHGLRLKVLTLFLESEPDRRIFHANSTEPPYNSPFLHQLPHRFRETQAKLESLVDVFTVQLRVVN